MISDLLYNICYMLIGVIVGYYHGYKSGAKDSNDRYPINAIQAANIELLKGIEDTYDIDIDLDDVINTINAKSHNNQPL